MLHLVFIEANMYVYYNQVSIAGRHLRTETLILA